MPYKDSKLLKKMLLLLSVQQQHHQEVTLYCHYYAAHCPYTHKHMTLHEYNATYMQYTYIHTYTRHTCIYFTCENILIILRARDHIALHCIAILLHSAVVVAH